MNMAFLKAKRKKKLQKMTARWTRLNLALLAPCKSPWEKKHSSGLYFLYVYYQRVVVLVCFLVWILWLVSDRWVSLNECAMLAWFQASYPTWPLSDTFLSLLSGTGPEAAPWLETRSDFSTEVLPFVCKLEHWDTCLRQFPFTWSLKMQMSLCFNSAGYTV